ncbi:ABC transporter, periplasmic spermidine putrescine-binding protein PotD [Escherichia coli]|nr:ABC transporter, periplasmic spermidine putrescine-binding protein PotD [Escherichia coli]
MKKWSRHLLAAGALALGMSAAHADDNNTLYFYNWTEYVPPGLLEQFTKETGIKVIYSTYESNETMYAKLKTYKDGAYDLVVPSTYYVDKLCVKICSGDDYCQYGLSGFMFVYR